MTAFDEAKTSITLSMDGKQWQCFSTAASWTELLQEFLYGLAGMGFFIDADDHDRILDAASARFKRCDTVLQQKVDDYGYIMDDEIDVEDDEDE